MVTFTVVDQNVQVKVSPWDIGRISATGFLVLDPSGIDGIMPVSPEDLRKIALKAEEVKVGGQIHQHVLTAKVRHFSPWN